MTTRIVRPGLEKPGASWPSNAIQRESIEQNRFTCLQGTVIVDENAVQIEKNEHAIWHIVAKAQNLLAQQCDIKMTQPSFIYVTLTKA